jgi:nucleoside-diphosphate-sugar epimerase
VGDTVDALLVLESLPAPLPFDVFNVGTGTALSVQDLLDVLGGILGTLVTPAADGARVRPVERPHLQADITKIERALGWRPRYTVREGLALLCKAEGVTA